MAMLDNKIIHKVVIGSHDNMADFYGHATRLGLNPPRKPISVPTYAVIFSDKTIGWFFNPSGKDTSLEGEVLSTSEFAAIYEDKSREVKAVNSAFEKQISGRHYKDLPIQPIEYCQKNNLNYCESNVIKYVTRHKHKNGKEDLLKAIHNLELLIEMEYGES